MWIIISIFLTPLIATADQDDHGNFNPNCDNWHLPCPMDAPSINCVVDPCIFENECASDGNTICHSNTCGGCYAVCCEPLFCPLDVFECPDGSFVSRDGRNNCNFFPCENDYVKGCREDLSICPDGTYVSRDPENDCEFFPCTDDFIVCTQEMFTCPGGELVGRDQENNCEFRKCPSFTTRNRKRRRRHKMKKRRKGKK